MMKLLAHLFAVAFLLFPGLAATPERSGMPNSSSTRTRRWHHSFMPGVVVAGSVS